MLAGNRLRTWTPQLSWAMALLLVPLLVHCGGQSELVSMAQSSGGTSSSLGGSTGLSGNTNPGVSQGPAPGGSTGVSGFTSNGGSTTLPLDAGLSCSMSASQYDNTCNVDSDCLGVPEGNPCLGGLCNSCPTAALNVRVASQYSADFRALIPTPSTGTICNCPCAPMAPCCRQGLCYNDCYMCT